MTIGELVRKQVFFYKRCDWPEGQFVHIDRTYTEPDHPETLAGATVCFCQAPFPADDPRADDDLWLGYEGPETATLVKTTQAVPVSLEQGVPGLLEALITAGVIPLEPHPPEVHFGEPPDTQPWQVGKEMRA